MVTAVSFGARPSPHSPTVALSEAEIVPCETEPEGYCSAETNDAANERRAVCDHKPNRAPEYQG